MPRFRVAAAARVLVAAALALTLAPAAASATAPTPDPAAGWHGRAIAHPQHDAAPARSGRPLAGWSAGPVGPGTGLHRAHGSRRVRELQRGLRRLGYRPGPVDGIFGPRTQAATTWFQIKHGLRRSGTATLGTIAHLRARTTPVRNGVTAHVRPAPTATAAPAATSGGGDFHWWPWILAALAIALASGALVSRSHTAPPQRGGRPRPCVLGYIRTPHDDDAAVDAHVAALEEECRARGLALEGIVTDRLDHRRGRQRPGLNYALDRLRTDHLDCLVVARIEQIADRQVDLHDTLERISQHGAVLVVLNAGPHHQPPPPRATPQRQPEHAHG